MNDRHNNMTFTFENEVDEVMSFLDIKVYRGENSFLTSIHRKQTFSGVYSNFTSFMPSEYKFGLVFTLLHRCFTLVTNFDNFHKEVEKLKEILRRNSYPSSVIDSCIYKFLNKVLVIAKVVQTVPKKDIFITLPYLGINSLQLRTKLVKTFAKSMPWCKLNIVFKTSNRPGSFFQFKDKLPQTLVSGVIYKYKCSRCNASYIGKTFRYYETRLQEHLDISALTGKPRKCLQLWPPKEHLKECRGINTRENFTIIGREKDRHLLRLKESISIYLQKPNLNDIRESTKLYLFN